MQFEEAKAYILARQQKELPRYLTYHSTGHVLDVSAAANAIAQQEGIPEPDRMILHTAALFHDSGFMLSLTEHEKISCDIAKATLPEYGYTNDQIDAICGMIMATRIPQQPANLLEQILCDADLDYLGRDDFFTIGNTLYAELISLGIVNNEEQWNKLQIDFLEKHHYFTTTAVNARAAKKAENLACIKAKLQIP